MRNADSNKTTKRSSSRPAAMIAAALLLSIPAATAFAESKTAEKPAAPAPGPVVPASTTEKAKEAPAPSAVAPTPAPPPVAGPQPEPAPIVIVRTEVYGSVVLRFGKNATILSLVSTSSEPVPVGSKALLMRKIEEPGKPPTYVEIAEVTIKKHAAGGKIELTVENEKKDVLVNGKKANHFLKNTKVKLQVDRPG